MSDVHDAARMRIAAARTFSRRWRDAKFAHAARIPSWVSPPIALRRSTIFSATILLLGVVAWAPSRAATPGLYEITTETLMPHLEDNLRYANTRERRCLHDNAPDVFFPILRHQSFNGCELGAGNGSDPVYYPLVCHSSQGPTGTAQLSGDAERVLGVIEIQMGGKNMAFSQRIEATRQGKCDSET